VSSTRFRAVAVVALAGALLWLPFAFGHANPGAVWLAVPFLAANVLLSVALGVSLVNNWWRSAPPAYTVPSGAEPEVAVIVPTAGESPDHVRLTVLSVLEQDWPHERLVIVVSDDAGNREIQRVAGELAAAHPAARIDYHRPPRRGSDEREGDAKAGNLNSALRRVAEIAPGAAFVETRDADDLVGDPRFLRRCVGQLVRDPTIAYVQTIKEARVSPGDPFDNLQPLFFRGAMLARHAANAVFPCGSGLVWRSAALAGIGGFPSWNLVEDLQSGVEALRRGWRGCYVPIVGAVGQHAPEDLPNVYKQRGTWALDTIRLLAWGRLRGLGVRQRLQFAELGLFYLQSFSLPVFVACPVIGAASGVYPLHTDYAAYALHFWPFAIAIELYFAALAVGVGYERVWRARLLWIGLAPVYMKACVLAVVGGRRRKPVYRVTRKHDEHRWYWRLVLPQMALLALLLAAIAKALATESLLLEADLGSLYWASIFAVMLGCFIPRSWFRVDVRARLAALVARRAAMPGRVGTDAAVYAVLPVCDEPEVLERAVRSTHAALGELGVAGRVLVVERRGFGESGTAARRLAAQLAGVEVVQAPRRGGLGLAQWAGLERALAAGADLVVQMDSDLSHDPADIPRLVEAAGGSDVAVGSRFVAAGRGRDRSALGRWLRRRGAAQVRARLALRLRDPTGGPACFRREALAALLPEAPPRNAYLLRLRLLAAAERAGCSVREVPVTAGPRRAGGMERSLLHAAVAAWQLWAGRAEPVPGGPVDPPPPSRRFSRGSGAPAWSRAGSD
jgi:cellulose synthase/poly-beta-1,6-N-acetylglucosamine synthase-like glycosyltransferase